MNHIFREEIILLHAKNIQINNRSWTGREVHEVGVQVYKELGKRNLWLIDYLKRMIADISSKHKEDGRKCKAKRTKGFCKHVKEAQRETN